MIRLDMTRYKLFLHESCGIYNVTNSNIKINSNSEFLIIRTS